MRNKSYKIRELVVGSVNSTFLQNSELGKKHKKTQNLAFTFLNHQKMQNNSSFFGFSICAVNLKKWFLCFLNSEFRVLQKSRIAGTYHWF